MAARGPKPKPRNLAREPLAVRVPADLRGRARTLYLRLARDLRVEGYACQGDARTVSLTARVEATVERLEREVEALAALQERGKVHPLLLELRLSRSQLAALYGQLFLSPRSRASARVSAAQARQAQAPDALTEFLDD